MAGEEVGRLHVTIDGNEKPMLNALERVELRMRRHEGYIGASAHNMANIYRDLSVTKLQLEGKTLEAEIQLLRSHFATRIQLAKSAAEKEALIRLEVLKMAELKNIHQPINNYGNAGSKLSSNGEGALAGGIAGGLASKGFNSLLRTVLRFGGALTAIDLVATTTTSFFEKTYEGKLEKIRGIPIAGGMLARGVESYKNWYQDQDKLDAIEARVVKGMAQLNSIRDAKRQAIAGLIDTSDAKFRAEREEEKAKQLLDYKELNNKLVKEERKRLDEIAAEVRGYEFDSRMKKFDKAVEKKRSRDKYLLDVRDELDKVIKSKPTFESGSGMSWTAYRLGGDPKREQQKVEVQNWQEMVTALQNILNNPPSIRKF